ncbi:MAG: hypothetical protein ABMA64_22235 [Myxococcota bacterium]
MSGWALAVVSGWLACARDPAPAPELAPEPVAPRAVGSIGEAAEGDAIDGLKRYVVGRDARGEERSFWAHVPAGATGPLPAVFVFHGGKGSTGLNIARFWTDQFDRGMVLVFPNGQLSDRSVGGWETDDGGDTWQVDNIRRLVDEVVSDLGVDPNRLYAVGFSSGGHIVNQLACQMPTTFRGYGRIGRVLLASTMRACKTPTERPQMMILGTRDDSARWDGKRGPDGQIHEQPVDVAWPFWLSAAGCPERPSATSTLPDRGDRVSVDVRDWGPCRSASAFRFVRITGADHQWPTGGRMPSPGVVPVRDLDATEAFLAFFRETGGL